MTVINTLGKEIISDQDVIEFLLETVKLLEERLGKVKDLEIQEVRESMAPAIDLISTCKNLAKKLQNKIVLSKEENDKLRDLILTTKKHIEMGIVEGTTEGIEEYLKVLK